MRMSASMCLVLMEMTGMVIARNSIARALHQLDLAHCIGQVSVVKL